MVLGQLMFFALPCSLVSGSERAVYKLTLIYTFFLQKSAHAMQNAPSSTVYRPRIFLVAALRSRSRRSGGLDFSWSRGSVASNPSNPPAYVHGSRCGISSPIIGPTTTTGIVRGVKSKRYTAYTWLDCYICYITQTVSEKSSIYF